MLKLSVLGLAVAVFCLTSPCQALIDPAADVLYHPADTATAETLLTGQIQAAKSLVVGVHASDPAPDPALDAYLADSHTSNPLVFGNLEAGAGGIISLDKFDPTRIPVPGGDPVGQLRGVLLYLTVHLKSGRYVLDNETKSAIQTATVQIGAELHVINSALGINFSATPFKEVTGALASDVNTNGTDPYDGKFPNGNLSETELDKYCVGADKLAAIIDSDDPANFFAYAPLYTDLTDPDKLALFTGSGTIDFVFTSDPYASATWTPSVLAYVWPSLVKFDIEARLVYLYADAAVPEPASMGLLVAAFAPVLLRRFRGRKSRLS